MLIYTQKNQVAPVAFAWSFLGTDPWPTLGDVAIAPHLIAAKVP